MVLGGIFTILNEKNCRFCNVFIDSYLAFCKVEQKDKHYEIRNKYILICLAVHDEEREIVQDLQRLGV